MMVVLATVFMLYAITAPRDVTLEDDGLFLMNLAFWGVNHPPGYPLLTLLGSPFFSAMPEFIPQALRGHLFSSFCGAVASTAVYASVAMLVRGRLAPLTAGLAFGASKVLWSQSIIAEVYALNAAMFFLVLALCLNYGSHQGPASYRHRCMYCLIAFVYGLGCSNHWPLLGLSSIGLLMIVISQWRNLFTRLPFGLAFLALGLLPYLFMVYQSHSDTPLNFYGSINSFKDFYFYVTRSGYSGVDKQANVGWSEKLAFISFMISELGVQMTLAGAALALAGFVGMIYSRTHFWLACALATSWFMAGPLLIYLLDFQDEFIWFSAFRVYPIISYGICAIWLGCGLGWLEDFLRRRLPSHSRLAKAALALVAIGTVSGSVVLHWGDNNRRDYTWARDLAVYKLISVERDTLLFTFDDLDLPLAYISYVEKVRPDVKVFNDQGLVFSNRIYPPFTNDEQRRREIHRLIESTTQPIYYHPGRTDYYKTKRYGSDFLGFWRRVNRDDAADRLVLSASLRLWIENSLDTYLTITDRWTRQQAVGLIATLVSTVQQASYSGLALDDAWLRVLDRAARENPLAHLVLLWGKFSQQKLTPEQARKEIDWLYRNADIDSYNYIVDDSNRSDMLMLRAQLAYAFPEVVESDLAELFESSLKASLAYKFKYQPARMLIDFYRGTDRLDEAIALLEDNFPDISLTDRNFRELHAQLDTERRSGKSLSPKLLLPSQDDSPASK